MPKKYFSNLEKLSKFTFYCQNQFFRLHFYNYTFPLQFQDGMVVHQAAQLSYIMSNKAEPFYLIQIFALLQLAPVTFRSRYSASERHHFVAFGNLKLYTELYFCETFRCSVCNLSLPGDVCKEKVKYFQWA